LIDGDPDRQYFRGSAIKRINVFELIVCFVEHPKFDISNRSSPILKVWRFERHDYSLNRTKRREILIMLRGSCARILSFCPPHGNEKLIRKGGGDFMKRTFAILFLFAFVFSAPADCPDNPCQANITKIGECPDEGCRKSSPDPDHPYDPELNKQKNIRSDNQQSLLRSIKWIKALPDPTNTTECGSRDEL